MATSPRKQLHYYYAVCMPQPIHTCTSIQWNLSTTVTSEQKISGSYREEVAASKNRAKCMEFCHLELKLSDCSK